MKTELEGMSRLRLPQFQRHGGRRDEALLKVVSPTQSAPYGGGGGGRRLRTAVTAVVAGAAG